jgi:sec-independent protein translocase protein TatC
MPTLFKGPNKDNDKEPRRKFTGDPEDFRLSLVEHLEELRDRIIRSLLIITGGWVIGWFIEPWLYAFLNDMARAAITPLMPKNVIWVEAFRNFADAFLLKFKLSFMIGVIIAFPFLVLQIWAFVMPALKPKEQAPVKRLAPFSLMLFMMGVGFAWAILGSAMHWFATYIVEFKDVGLIQEPGTMVFFTLKMLAAFGIAFQLPLIVYMLGELELLSAETLFKHWRQAATGIFVIAMIVTPSQDPMTMLMMAIPLVILFMASVYLVKFTQGRKKKARMLNPDEANNDDTYDES